MKNFREFLKSEVGLINFRLKREAKMLRERVVDGKTITTYIFRSRKVEVVDDQGKLSILTPVLV